jgi:hypothetical protein
MVFKTIGYVEKAGGQLEAIILQENQIQVVHIGDRIADRYRVTSITPDSVDALDETLVQSSMAQSGAAKPEAVAVKGTELPPSKSVAWARPEITTAAAESAQPQNSRGVEAVAGSLGYVQQANGKVMAVVGDGETVKLVPETPTETMAQVAPPGIPAGTAAAPATSEQALSASNHVPDGHAAPLPDRHPEAPAIRLASYPVPAPAVQGAAPLGFSLNSAGGPSGTVSAASSPAATNLTARLAGATERVAKLPVEVKPLGYVVKADGQFAAVVSQDDEVYIVRPGDRFAGHYRALSVSADLVEAVEEPPRQPPPPSFTAPPAFPDLLSASAEAGSSLLSNDGCLDCKFGGVGEVSLKAPEGPPGEVESPPPRSRPGIGSANHNGQDGHAQSSTPPAGGQVQDGPSAFIFQTLGTVETQDGEVQAIVADGSQLYLVKQGETFADQYRATSVDPLLVLAVKVSPGEQANNSLSAGTESGGGIASNYTYGYLHSSPAGGANFRGMDASGSRILADLGVNLFNPLSTGISY